MFDVLCPVDVFTFKKKSRSVFYCVQQNIKRQIGKNMFVLRVYIQEHISLYCYSLLCYMHTVFTFSRTVTATPPSHRFWMTRRMATLPLHTFV